MSTLMQGNEDARLTPRGHNAMASQWDQLRGKRAAVVTLSPYPDDPRPRRTIDALIAKGVSVDVFCLGDGKYPIRQGTNGVNVWRIPLRHRRQGRLAYAYEYSLFIVTATILVTINCLRHQYDLIYVNNMPDVLIVCALIPKALGAKVVLDLHDPMPELMMTIFGGDAQSPVVRLLRWLEKWSIARAHFVITVNKACRRLIGGRSCDLKKVGVVMNAPDGELFPVREPRPRRASETAPFVLMYHGSLVERNGLDLAIAALSQVVQTIPRAELRIYGRRTPFLEVVMRTVDDRGLQANVRYLGPRPVDELPREIEQCDVGVVPNRRNPFTELNMPTRIFEYLTIGKPVIAPNTPGIKDYFRDGSLLFFEPGDADDLAQKIQYAYFRPLETVQTARRGQQVYLAHTWECERVALLHTIGSLLADKPVRQPSPGFRITEKQGN